MIFIELKFYSTTSGDNFSRWDVIMWDPIPFGTKLEHIFIP